MKFWLLGVVLMAAAVDWLVILVRSRKARLVTKPAVLVLLLVWFFLTGGWRGPLLWYGLALIFSLLGDMLLMNRSDQFVFGLAAFLLAHLAYLVGFNRILPPLSLPILALAAVGAILMGWIYPIIRRGVLGRPGRGALQWPVFFYSLVLTLMMLSAVSTLFRPEWHPAAAVLVASGGVLFFVSDILLAFDRFVRPLRQRSLLVMIPYHLGQIGLAMGAVIQYT